VQVCAACAPRFPCLPSEQIGKNIVSGKIRESGTVLIGIVFPSLGGKILVKSRAWPVGPRSVDLSAIKALTLVRI